MAGASNQLILLGMNAALGGFLFGYDTGSMSSALLEIREPSNSTACPGLESTYMSTTNQEMITAFVTLGAFIGALGSGFLNHYTGRKYAIIIAAALFFFGALGQGTAIDLAWMLIARIVCGLGVGICSHTVPLFIAECAPAEDRAWLCFLNDMMVVFGQLIAYAVGTIFFYTEVRYGWRWILGLGALPAVVMFVGMFFQPESPRWLLLNKRDEEARESLRLMRAEDVEIEEEFASIVNGLAQERPLIDQAETGWFAGTSKYWEDVRIRRALMYGCGLQMLQQFVGINAIMYYGATVIEESSGTTLGLTGEEFAASSDYNCFTTTNKEDVAYTNIFAAAQLIGVFVSFWWLVERFGRRPLLLSSVASGTIALVLVGIAFAFDTVSTAAVVIFVVLYLMCFGFGLSPLPWTINAEIYPLPVRAQCMSLATSMNWLCDFIVTETYLTLGSALSTSSTDAADHPDGVFWLFAAIGATGFCLLWWKMPETKGMALEDIGELFMDGPAQ
eukprot:NODE_4662_length_1864_cov_1.567070.p1 GENE.NODE_4662_length_1864_cov_1.567070~~NODE_4662_length_1864_cov_1.567070.p1  ORF type:complete len:503 (+),score=160.65 NODE_4662_length_1864_cov_1.567070:119-1627(+)